MDITFFERPEQFRAWLEAHHASESELRVGFYKKGSGKPSITWPESVDQALCFGWIDGVRKGIDESSYMIRFTPRKARSIWSAVNIKRVEELTALGLMRPAGLRAFEQRTESRSRIYAYEQDEQGLAPEYEERFRADEKAWAFFEAQAAWYRRSAVHWVMHAKKEETRERRLATLIDDSAHGRRLARLSYGDRK